VLKTRRIPRTLSALLLVELSIQGFYWIFATLAHTQNKSWCSRTNPDTRVPTTWGQSQFSKGTVWPATASAAAKTAPPKAGGWWMPITAHYRLTCGKWFVIAGIIGVIPLGGGAGY